MVANKFYILILFAFLSFQITAQGEASKWYFGNYAGLDFSSGTPVALNNIPMTGVNLNSEEGCTTISNSAGELLFYTNGKIVWNKNHGIMENGTNLGGDQSSTQSAIIIPSPQASDIYYVFTVDEHNTNRQGLSYSVVDMTLNNGLGAVTSRNTNLLRHCAEKITAVRSNNCNEFWVIAYGNETGSINYNYNSFFAFKINENGVDPNYIRSTFGDTTGLSDGRGYLKVNAEGDKIAIAHQGRGANGTFLYDFNFTTGEVSNSRPLFPVDDFTGNSYFVEPYGIEFSLSGRFLYVTSSFSDNPRSSVLFQYDLDNDNAARHISTDETFRGALQMAPNGKIYRSLSINYDLGSKYLGVIHNPESLGVACNYQHNAIDIDPNNEGRKSRQGLPPFVQSMFLGVVNIINPESATIETSLKLCEGQTYTLTAPSYNLATYTWYKDGVTLPNTSNSLIINETGLYRVQISAPEFECPIKGEAKVDIPNLPTISLQPNDAVVCETSSLNNLGIDFNEQTQGILGNQLSTQYTVVYFYSLADAVANENAIVLPLETATNFGNTRIYARIHALSNPNCHLITEPFDLIIINNTNIITELTDLSFCGDVDGITTISSTNLNSLLFTDAQSGLYTISYFLTEDEAVNNTNAITQSRIQTTTVYARIENKITNLCVKILPVNITVNTLPNVQIFDVQHCSFDVASIYNLLTIKEYYQEQNPGFTFEFYATAADLNVQQNGLQIVTLNRNLTTVYYTVKNNETGCLSNNQFTITNFFNVNTQNVTLCAEANQNSTVYNLENYSTTGKFYTTLNDAYLNENAITDLNRTFTTDEVLYYKELNQNLSCTNLVEIHFILSQKPNVTPYQNIRICIDNTDRIEIHSGLISNPTTTYTYQWSTGETTPSIIVNEIGTYTVVVTNSLGCKNTATIEVENFVFPTLQNIIITDLNPISRVEVVLNDTTDMLFSLDGINFQTSNLFNYVSPGIYSLTIKDRFNCSFITREVAVLGVRNFFTPNGDGIFDTWTVQGVSSNHYPNTKVSIFDRYGKLLKSFNPIHDTWDGTYNNIPQPATDYWFIIELEDGRSYKSHFSLKR